MYPTVYVIIASGLIVALACVCTVRTNMRMAAHLPVWHAKFNWLGPLPPKVTWEWANKLHMGPPMHIDIPPTRCPHCPRLIVISEHDEWTMDNDSKQHMVITYACPDGHGAYVHWA